MPLSRNAILSLATLFSLGAAVPARAATPDELRAHVARLQTLTAACSGSASACRAEDVGADEGVGYTREPGGYEVQWKWLRSALTAAANDKPEDRVEHMRQAGERLASMAADLNAPAPPDTFARAHDAAAKTLSASEFRTSSDNITWWDRFKARLWKWIAGAFEGLNDSAGKHPWVGKSLAIALFVLAGAGLVFFLRRQLADNRLRVRLNESGAPASGWARESKAWADLANEGAAEGDFREAVHCLYWAAIVLLEGRRAWRHDPSRTPREYVRLLATGSAQRDHLRKLTALFERLWYGLRATTEADYLAARDHFAALETSRAGGTPSPTAAGPETA